MPLFKRKMLTIEPVVYGEDSTRHVSCCLAEDVPLTHADYLATMMRKCHLKDNGTNQMLVTLSHQRFQNHQADVDASGLGNAD